MFFYALRGFELANGRHTPQLRPIQPHEIPAGYTVRSSLWADAEMGRWELLNTISHPKNQPMLLALAGLPQDSRVHWTIRDVGDANAMGLVALISRQSGGTQLLMVSASTGKTNAARLREHVAQAVRSALVTMASVRVADKITWKRLVVINTWRRGVRIPTEARPMPALQSLPSVLDTVPEPSVWGVVPFVRDVRTDKIFVAIAPWHEFNQDPWWELTNEVVAPPWESWTPVNVPGWGPDGLLEVEQHGDSVRVSLAVKSSAHKASMKQDRHQSVTARRIRMLRRACYSGHFDVSAGRFVGETIENGTPRFHWEWVSGQVANPEAARNAILRKLEELIQ